MGYSTGIITIADGTNGSQVETGSMFGLEECETGGIGNNGCGFLSGLLRKPLNLL